MSTISNALHRRYQYLKTLEMQKSNMLILDFDSISTSGSKAILKKYDSSQESKAETEEVLPYEPELRVLRALNGVVGTPRYLGCFEKEDGFYIIQEYIDASTVHDLISESYEWSETSFKYFLKSISQTLRDIHDRGFIHCNIRSQTILYNLHSKACWLSGFDNVFSIDEPISIKQIQVSSSKYFKQKDKAPSIQDDIYALGVVCLELLLKRSLTEDEVLGVLKGDKTWQANTSVQGEVLVIILNLINRSYETCDEIILDLDESKKKISKDYLFTTTEVFDTFTKNTPDKNCNLDQTKPEVEIDNPITGSSVNRRQPSPSYPKTRIISEGRAEPPDIGRPLKPITHKFLRLLILSPKVKVLIPIFIFLLFSLSIVSYVLKPFR